MILYWLFEHALWLTKSPDGRPVGTASIGSFHFDNPSQYYLLVLAFTVAGAVVYLNILRSGLGRAMEAVRDLPVVGQLVGINRRRTQLTAVAVGHLYAGCATTLCGGG